ncbi:hypothetical protein F2P81_007591 [Scophthalmus maximus]|uniref:Cadherin domain-containing protein n=1 Tax=Scophthalmus maximus TaxID=52904 RepID=A0A6A4SVT6_SCOMX|nr:hypothetical protein F2P81_007591 [Scophthalmus maximus]
MGQRRGIHYWWATFCVCVTLCCVVPVSAQIKYSVPEQVKVGSIVGNVAKDLGLDISSLEDRRFRIVSGTEDSQFDVNQNNGALYVRKNIDREELCESASSCLINLKMVAEDPMEIHYVAVEIIDVNDHSPNFEEEEHVLEIAESTLSGQRFQLPTARDPDVGTNTVHKDTGEIRVKGEIDFEMVDVYKLDVHATDRGQPPMSTDCRVIIKVIDENDNTPEIEVTSLSKMVSEDSKPGTVVSLISVTDRDAGLNGKVTCSLSDNVPFELKPSFQDNMYSLVLKHRLDRESVSHYDLEITATDFGQPPLSTFKTLSIDVSDVNDNNPEFLYNPVELYLVENNVPGRIIFSVTASDKDLDENAALTYHIVREEVANTRFNIDLL